jgi:hypothetical protein
VQSHDLQIRGDRRSDPLCLVEYIINWAFKLVGHHVDQVGSHDWVTDCSVDGSSTIQLWLVTKPPLLSQVPTTENRSLGGQ